MMLVGKAARQSHLDECKGSCEERGHGGRIAVGPTIGRGDGGSGRSTERPLRDFLALPLRTADDTAEVHALEFWILVR